MCIRDRYKSDLSLALQAKAKGAPPLTFYHIRSLAGRHSVSIRSMICALHRHALLDETQCGIAVMRVAKNAYTGKDVGLRIRQIACPTWGFILPNKRVSRLGFAQAADVFDNCISQQTHVTKETILVWLNSEYFKIKYPQKWIREYPLSTTCAYTPVDVNNEGRYLVTIWSWPPSVSSDILSNAH